MRSFEEFKKEYKHLSPYCALLAYKEEQRIQIDKLEKQNQELMQDALKLVAALGQLRVHMDASGNAITFIDTYLKEWNENHGSPVK